jgi:hypothetical protein
VYKRNYRFDKNLSGNPSKWVNFAVVVASVPIKDK